MITDWSHTFWLRVWRGIFILQLWFSWAGYHWDKGLSRLLESAKCFFLTEENMIPKTLLQAKTADWCRDLTRTPHPPRTLVVTQCKFCLYLHSGAHKHNPFTLFRWWAATLNNHGGFHLSCFDLPPLGLRRSGVGGVGPLCLVLNAAASAVQKLHAVKKKLLYRLSTLTPNLSHYFYFVQWISFPQMLLLWRAQKGAQ